MARGGFVLDRTFSILDEWVREADMIMILLWDPQRGWYAGHDARGPLWAISYLRAYMFSSRESAELHQSEFGYALIGTETVEVSYVAPACSSKN